MIKKTVFSFWLCMAYLFAGQFTVTGRVLSSANRPLQGAECMFRDLSAGTVTNVDGYFRLTLPVSSLPDTLTISHIGFLSKKILIKQDGSGHLKNIHLLSRVIPYSETVQVTADRSSGTVSESSMSVERISAGQLTEGSAADILDAAVSLGIRDYGGAGAMKTVMLRGATAGQVLVLLNGQRLNSPQNGEVDLGMIQSAMIDRIEIVRGGQSALYGSDAVGGVINLITRKPESDEKQEFETGLSLRTGSFGLRELQAHIDAKNGDFAVNTGIQWTQSRGDFPFTGNWNLEQIRKNNDSRALQLFGTLQYTKPAWFSRITATRIQTERGAPGPLDPGYLEARQYDSRTTLQLRSVFSKDEYILEADLNWDYSENRYVNNEMLVPLDNHYTTESPSAELRAKIDFGKLAEITAGSGVQIQSQQTLHQDTAYYRQSIFAYLLDESRIQTEWPFLKYVKFNAALRVDAYSDFGHTVSPRAGLFMMLDTKERFSLRFSAGSAFRAPTFNDLYWPRDAFAEGNPNLQPERGRDFESGLRWTSANTSVFAEMVIFRRSIDDMIIWLDHAGLWWPQNLSSARLGGLELVWQTVPVSHLRLKGNYTYLYSENLSDNESEYGKLLPYRPKHTLNTSLVYSWKGLQLSSDMKYVSRQFTDTHNVYLFSLDPYFLVETGAVYRFPLKKIDIILGAYIKNIFNVSYRTLENIPMPGREFQLNIEIKYHNNHSH